ncbi:LOW QUALITY PROTEIN: hypothetical protein SPRG_12806 [Saprolegnia parasitica CBS 223.65]|uniref:RanBP2-type domain-containing protein n=1 Tax=Saprolegnia parasitica (strain CBS 223.65) TaxID=695850 RepID=A0A067BZR4_SAPPC|nr:LOW QUALITY PROTEIN: hypothetical protein SPRG_12806 [Saprolegnia parasitica CBS 223.65]KDO22345.1 LOW QUALITY PROTEIN: hypothetical protein SPRG_12806 [Saprolegnia parasitica CBS 223.65]|eukprot:XP_012206979.1 LOW QUALITY PROTEIN: hypothetical protein SPRG_12806 [Saprolegnia parasitica CBS 223.65]
MANYLTQAVIPMAIIVLCLACFVYFCIFKLMAKPLPFTLGRPLLSNEYDLANRHGTSPIATFLGAIHGLNRQDIEELCAMRYANAWRCLVCAFENAEVSTTCVLCDSAKGTLRHFL